MTAQTKIRLPLDDADKIALRLVHALQPACQRIEVAGSIRRRKPFVGDIEIVAIPNPDDGLFNTAPSLSVCIDIAISHNLLAFGPLDGPKQKKLRVPQVEGLFLDLFLTTPEQWGVILAIRTGPAEFSKRMVTSYDKGGLLPDASRISRGRLWFCDEAIDTPEEADLFKHLTCGWIPPEQRHG